MTDEIIYCASGCIRWSAHLPSCTNTDLHVDECDRVGCPGCHLCRGCEPRLAALVPRNPKPGEEVVIFELGEPEPRWVPGWIAKWNERSGRIAAGVRIEG